VSDPLFLTRIRLQQFRTFADLDVPLDAAPGVLIVQGSNGLGKSSLFHGLEWVLTDQIEEFRLVDDKRKPATYLCRWKKRAHEQTAVAMEFSDGQTLRRDLPTAKVGKSGWQGPVDVAAYLRADDWNADIQNLRHYLLLTHFLSQSNLPRVSHRDDKARFDILKDAAQSREPERIARALHGAGQTRPAKAFKALIDRLDTERAAIDQLLQQEATAWADAQIAGALDPASAIAVGRETAGLLRQALGQPLEVEAADDVSPTALAAALQAAGLTLDRDALAATRAREVFSERARLEIDLAEAQVGLQACDDRLAALPQEEAVARTAAEHAEARLADAGQSLTTAQNRQEALAELAAARSTLAELRKAEEGRPSAAELDLRLRQAEAAVAALERRRRIVARLAAELAVLREDANRTRSHQNIVDDLEAHASRRASETAALEALEGAHPTLEADLAGLEQDVLASARSLDTLETSISALRDATDAIAGAVSTIVSNLNPQSCECPVCATRFPTPEALRGKAHAAAARLAPELERQQARLREAHRIHETLTDRKAVLVALNAQVDAQRATLDAERQGWAAAVRRASDVGLEIPASLSAWRGSLDAEARLLQRRGARRRRWLDQLKLQDAASALQSATRARDAAIGHRDMHARARVDAAAQQAWSSSEIERLRLAVFGPQVQEGVEEDEASRLIEAEATDARARRDALQAEVARADQAVTRLAQEAAGLTARRPGLAVRLTELQRQRVAQDQEWRALGMTTPLSPAASTDLDDRDVRLAAARVSLADAEARLRRLRDGLAAASRQRAHRDAVERLRTHLAAASNHTREQVREAGEARSAALAARSAVAKRSKALAADASARIEESLNDFNADYIRPLADLMGRINRSILCDPRIGIDFRVDRNAVGQAAKVGDEIPADRGDVDPRLVHSEGQMAALGVSLLCAASLTFPWSRWKALVLDDPLQHNDAIHASAFSDFVGNLVNAKGYQVLLSTHELAQAEFLKRKFRARNIPCTMVTLLGAGADGVEARIDRPEPPKALSA